jgi:hypothetical protein
MTLQIFQQKRLLDRAQPTVRINSYPRGALTLEQSLRLIGLILVF